MTGVPLRARLASLVALRCTGSEHEVLLLKRAVTLIGTWCQVVGTIEGGEAAWQTAVRELQEETGLAPHALYSADICEQFYEAHSNAIVIAPVFVAVVDPAAAVVLNHEHSAYRWVSFAEAIAMVSFGGQRRVLRWIEEEFVHRRPSPHLTIELSG